MEAVQVSFWVVVALLMLALAFDFMNGFHDAANSIATVVSTGVLKPLQAVGFAAVCNVIAIFVFKLSVAATVGKGIVDPAVVDHYVIFGALIGAIAWNVITWYYGIPSSSSHALIGGLVGATLAKAMKEAHNIMKDSMYGGKIICWIDAPDYVVRPHPDFFRVAVGKQLVNMV